MMIASLRTVTRRLQFLLDTLNSRLFPPPGNQLTFGLDVVPPAALSVKTAPLMSNSTFLESLKDGFVWGVPKHRVTKQTRHRRWFSHNHIKYWLPRKDILTCLHCGHPYEADTICGNCYGNVRKETQAIQKAMNIEERIPHSQEVIVLYEGEVADPEKAKGLKPAHVPQKRPHWFSSSLLTKVIEGKS
ncbi:39S ribosomal protein L32, mitochondrial-like [Paramacrobiotus metropolitanus]|uniref:39S ribosomal protein L32, mitochondrial-like n=1 Tax=Paramacrobiotus metropolitanus TaxID=2943436 RepID=UPI0024463852|nr:39S ribosomal protein L32, mitochondrial-like [Paramacrobiotus metropolitanus]